MMSGIFHWIHTLFFENEHKNNTNIDYNKHISKGDDVKTKNDMERRMDMNVKIIGANCRNGIQLCKVITRVAEEHDNIIKIEKLDDQKSMGKYGVKNIPGLVVNDNLVSEGKVLSQREFEKIIDHME